MVTPDLTAAATMPLQVSTSVHSLPLRSQWGAQKYGAGWLLSDRGFHVRVRELSSTRPDRHRTSGSGKFESSCTHAQRMELEANPRFRI